MEILRARKARLSLDIAPLIDIVFQLLVFFMLASTFSQPSIRMELPRAVEHDLEERQVIAVSIGRDGAVFLNDKPVERGALSHKLESLLGEVPKKSVHLRGDKEMPYKFFVEVMDIARRAGALQVNIVHQPMER